MRWNIWSNQWRWYFHHIWPCYNMCQRLWLSEITHCFITLVTHYQQPLSRPRDPKSAKCNDIWKMQWVDVIAFEYINICTIWSIVSRDFFQMLLHFPKRNYIWWNLITFNLSGQTGYWKFITRSHLIDSNWFTDVEKFYPCKNPLMLFPKPIFFESWENLNMRLFVLCCFRIAFDISTTLSLLHPDIPTDELFQYRFISSWSFGSCKAIVVWYL